MQCDTHDLRTCMPSFIFIHILNHVYIPQNKAQPFPGVPWAHDNVSEVKQWLVRVGKKLMGEGRLAVKPARWDQAKLDTGLDAISFLFKSYRVSRVNV